ncbi:DUF979 family protein, partial [Staphylococcus aureus]
FTVITASIGIPFVIAQGGDPIVAGALAMTGGFCGTLLTPMAANFNTLPVALYCKWWWVKVHFKRYLFIFT